MGYDRASSRRRRSVAPQFHRCRPFRPPVVWRWALRFRVWPMRVRSGLRPGAMTPLLPNEISAWIVIDPDETITIRIPHAEMGQGAATSNPMLVAEELECDWAKIKGEFASPNRNVRENNVYQATRTRSVRAALRRPGNICSRRAPARARG